MIFRHALIVLLLIPTFLKAEERNVSLKDRLLKEENQRLLERSNSEPELDKVAKDYEAFAITKQLQQMYSGVKVDELLGGGKSEEIYRDLLLAEYGKIMAERGGFGFAKALKKDMMAKNKVQNDTGQ